MEDYKEGFLSELSVYASHDIHEVCEKEMDVTENAAILPK
jgi:hypothetical protein